MTARPALLVVLLATLVLTALSMWWTKAAPPQATVAAARWPVAESGGAARVDTVQTPGAAEAVAPDLAAAGLQGSVRPALEPAARDIFSAVTPPSVAVQAPPPRAAELPPTVAAAPAPPPRVITRVVGRMKDPDGATLIFVSDGQQTLQARPGLALANGYRIDAIVPATQTGSKAIELRLIHVGSSHRELLQVPLGEGE